MAADLASAVGAGVSVRLAGADYFVAPLTLGDLGAIQNQLRLKQADLLGDAGRAAAGLPPETQKILLAEAVREHRRNGQVPIDEALAWAVNTMEGIAFTLWLAIGKRHPGVLSAEQVEGHVRAMSIAELQELSRRLAAAGGVGPEGNQPGRTATQTEPGPNSDVEKTGEKSS